MRVVQWWTAVLILPEVLPLLQPTFTRRTSGHCLGTFIAINLSIFLLGLYVVPHTVPPTVLSFCISPSLSS
jgi:hypothetical protein